MPETMVSVQSSRSGSSFSAPKKLSRTPPTSHVPCSQLASASHHAAGMANIATPTPNQPICVIARTADGMLEPRVPNE